MVDHSLDMPTSIVEQSAPLQVAVLNATFVLALAMHAPTIEFPDNLQLDVDPVLRSAERHSVITRVNAARALIVPSSIQGFPTSVDLERLPNLRMIAVAASGFDRYDLDGWRRRGITVTNAVGGLAADSVAEHAIALMLATLRRWSVTCSAFAGDDGTPPVIGRLLRGRTVAIVGFGNVGRRTAQLASSFGARIVAVTRSARDGQRVPGLLGEVMSLDDALPISDIVSLHLRLDTATRSMIDERRLGAMRPGSVLINTARSGLIDETALANALTSGHLGGAALDDLPTTELLRDAPNLIAFRHIGNRSLEGTRDVVQQVLQDLARFAAGASPHHLVAKCPT